MIVSLRLDPGAAFFDEELYEFFGIHIPRGDNFAAELLKLASLFTGIPAEREGISFKPGFSI